MPQVSKKTLKPWVEKRMWDVLEKTLTKMGSTSDSHDFLVDILTPTERVMVAKRLAIAVLLIKGYDYRHICHILKVSSATILSVFKQLSMSGDGYRKAAKRIIADRQREEFFKGLEAEICKLFAGSRSVKSRIDASYRKGQFQREAQYL